MTDPDKTQELKLYGGSPVSQCLEQIRELHEGGALLYLDARLDAGVLRVRMDVLDSEWERIKPDWPEDR